MTLTGTPLCHLKWTLLRGDGEAHVGGHYLISPGMRVAVWWLLIESEAGRDDPRQHSLWVGVCESEREKDLCELKVSHIILICCFRPPFPSQQWRNNQRTSGLMIQQVAAVWRDSSLIRPRLHIQLRLTCSFSIKLLVHKNTFSWSLNLLLKTKFVLNCEIRSDAETKNK